jgi:tRNA U34 5-carboxymethylaminomethyl modifying GTPase MnmE/TrmE
MFGRDDTIAAIASPPGGGLRGIVRVSGPATESIWRTFCEPRSPVSATAARVVSVSVRLPAPWPPIQALLCWWPGPRSYTRQPVAELHLPGSPPLLDAVLAAICHAGARLAEPGEFTLRAFLSGRMDLTQAEAVLGVIDARGQRELETALEQLAGGLASPLHNLRQRLVHTLAELEAGLDFVEEDIEFVSARQLHDQLTAGLDEVERLRTRLRSRAAAGGLPRVVLLGPPNAGKSSLWNTLVGEPAALVADRPGTTRDYLERETNFNGYRCVVVDTAGLEATSGDDPIGEAAQRATLKQGERAELRLVCREATSATRFRANTSNLLAYADTPQSDTPQSNTPGVDSPHPYSPHPYSPLADAPDAGHAASDGAADAKTAEPAETGETAKTDAETDQDITRLAVWTKVDQLASRPQDSAGEVWVSSLTGTGLDELRRRIVERLERLADAESAVVAGTAARCQESLRRASESLARAIALARTAAGLDRALPALSSSGNPTAHGEIERAGETESDGEHDQSGDHERLGFQVGDSVYGSHGRDEYIAAELRLALDALGQVAGAVHTEDILDVVFSRFCIGK